MIAWVAAAVTVVFFAVIATALTGSTGEGAAAFQRGDQAAMIGLGLAFGLGILTFARPRLEADARGVKIKNMIGGYELPWEVVRTVRFDRNSAWASLELADDDVVAVMAIQRADKQHAVEAVRHLRAMLAANQAHPAETAVEAGVDAAVDAGVDAVAQPARPEPA
jgi:hypothetical protein